MSKDSGLQITALITRTSSDIEERVDYNIRKAISDSLGALSKKMLEDKNMTIAQLQKALSDGGVMLSISNAQLGTMGMQVAQFKAKAAKAEERSMTLAERIVELEAKKREMQGAIDMLEARCAKYDQPSTVSDSIPWHLKQLCEYVGAEYDEDLYMGDILDKRITRQVRELKDEIEELQHEIWEANNTRD